MNKYTMECNYRLYKYIEDFFKCGEHNQSSIDTFINKMYYDKQPVFDNEEDKKNWVVKEWVNYLELFLKDELEAMEETMEDIPYDMFKDYVYEELDKHKITY